MPDKQHENKIMAMLERKGIVRKAGSDGEQEGFEQDSPGSRADTDLSSAFNSPAADDTRTPVPPRQPVPGMSNPVFPGRSPQDTRSEQPRAALPTAGPPPQAYSDMINKAQPWTPPTASPEAFSDDFDSFSEAVPWSDEQGEAAGLSGGGFGADSLEQRAASAADLTDGYHGIDELYDALSLKSARKDNIFLIEEYLKTLPESLPEESRRDIVGRIVTASGFDNDMLMGDGVLRVKMLKEYAERFARRTDEYVAARQTELDELEQQVLRVRKLIEARRELHKKQFFTIETEAQRLKDILTFITG